MCRNRTCSSTVVVVLAVSNIFKFLFNLIIVQLQRDEVCVGGFYHIFTVIFTAARTYLDKNG